MFGYYISACDAKAQNKSLATQFECVNELKDYSSRTVDNLLKFTRFVFESDTLSKLQQLDIANKLIEQKIVNRIVDSGNKSIHIIIEVADCEALASMQLDKAIKYYKLVWHYLNKKFFNSNCDTACSNPNRLTRTPNAIRISNSTIQKLIAEPSFVYKLTKDDKAAIKSELDKTRMLSLLCNNSFKNVSVNNYGICESWDVIQRYLNTPFIKMSGNVNSSKWLYAAIKTCQKYKDDQTLQKVLDKARREHWSEAELQHKLK